MKNCLLLSTICVLLLGFISQSHAQNSAEIYEDIEKLNVLGSVLYLAAHPDDENTRLISYFASERKTRTAYLSLTRGDGGQNLIGTDMREKLGLIRTNELLGARSIDGGQQYFSRANDFGYSKNPKETLELWNKDEVMHDIIKVIREFKPDIIVNRFDHKTPGRTHGHHTSSAMLSVEAFDLAGDANVLADRLSGLEPWQPERIFFNTSWWFYGSRDKFAEADKSNLYGVDAGVYYPLRGTSNTEIAALSRSMHKSQGFGSSGSRGSEMEYLEYIKGSRPADKQDPLAGIDITWGRVKGGAPIKAMIDELLANYNFKKPESNVSKLIEIYKAIEGLSDGHWRNIKLAEVQDIIVASTGLFLSASTKDGFGTPGSELYVEFEMINRSGIETSIQSASVQGGDPIDLEIPLLNNEKKSLETTISIDTDREYSNPYWLRNPGTMGMYAVGDESMIGKPMNDAAYIATFNVTIAGLPLTVNRDLVHRYNDPVKGEVVAPYHILPVASIAFAEPVYIFPNRTDKEVVVKVKALKDDLQGVLSLDYPNSWHVSPKIVNISLKNKGEEQLFTFTIKGPLLSESSEFGAQILTNDGNFITDEVYEIEEDHLPKLIMMSPAKAKFERISLEIKGTKIAYIQGAGDDIPANLSQIGYEVDEIEVGELTTDKLESYDALILGVRAYNTQKDLFLKKEVLMEYMTGGGTVVVQYNTNRGVKGDDIAPYPMELSRDRVTDENATMSFEDGEHEVLNYPNKISTRDFQNWVQERGLYFAKNWDPRYQTPLASSDPLEPLTKGGLVIADVGKGHWIYTGISWFRQLPAGVPGAYRLFANIISIGKNGIEPAAVPAETSGNE